MLDSRLNVLLAVFDLSAAFDTVSHVRILEKLERQYGFNDAVIAWFTSYLSHSQYY